MSTDPSSSFIQSILRSQSTIYIILFLALGLRFYKSGVHGIYLDEKLTLVCTQGVVLEGSNRQDVFFTPGKTYFTPAEFWKPKTLQDYNEAIIRSDISNSPAYTAMRSGWVRMFGIHDLSIRFPSVPFSTFIVGLIFLLVDQYLRSRSLALGCALLAAIEPFFIAYSHMARSYSTTIFVSLLATYLFLRLLDKRAENRQPIGLYISHGLCFALTILGHYLGALVFVCHGLYLLFYIRDWKTYGSLTLIWGLALLLVLPWFVWGGGKYIFTTMSYNAYAPGGTILYPLARNVPRDEIEKTYSPYSIMNAQYTNLYLPTDATYFQRMDTTQTDRIILVKGNSDQRITIFDFEGTKYRY